MISAYQVAIVLFLTLVLLKTSECNAENSSISNNAIAINQTGILCYACMSKNIPATSRMILEESTNIERGIQTDSCDDPFDFRSATVEPCSSACLKVISCNQEFRIVLRGCLTVIYPQIPYDQLKSHSEDFSQCDTQRQQNGDVGEIVTQTCLCTPSFCNSVSHIPHNAFANCIVMFTVVLISHLT